MKNISKENLLQVLEKHIVSTRSMIDSTVNQDVIWTQVIHNNALVLEALYFIVQNEDDGSEHLRLSDAVSEFLHEFAPSEHGDMPGIMLNLAQDVRDGKR